MTREEAIKDIEENILPVVGGKSLCMAIEALKAQTDGDTISRQAAIDIDGLDVEIRCSMCKNPMHTNRGCDGNCKYDEKLYERIMQILGERIKPLPSAQPEIIRCKDCKYYDPNDHCYLQGAEADDFCSYAERRTDERLNQQTGCN